MGNSQCCRGEEDKSANGVDGAVADMSDKMVIQKPLTEQEIAAEKEKKAKEAAKKKKAAKEKAARQAKEDAERQFKENAKRKQEEAEKEQQLWQARLGDLGRPGAKLQIELENGWNNVDDDYYKQVCNHVAAGATKFAVQARGAMYFVDWSNPAVPMQKNVRTGKTHKLRIQ